MTAKLFGDLNEQEYKFSMMTTGISSHVRYLLEEKGVRLLSLSLLSNRTSIKTVSMRWSVFSTSVANDDSCSRLNEIMKTPALRKSKYYILYWQFLTSQQLWLHSPIDGSVERKQIASFIFGFYFYVEVALVLKLAPY